MSRKENINLLIEQLRNDLFVLLSQYKEGIDPSYFELNYQAKNLIENYRSVLDYLIRIMIETLNLKTNGRILFPIAWLGCKEEEFKKKLRKSFPDLENINNKLFEKLIWFQGFEQAHNSLRELGRLGNHSKHEDLLEHSLKNFRVVHLIYDDVIIASIGDHLIYNTSLFRAEAIDLQHPESKLIFNLSDVTICINGPQEINKNTLKIDHFNKIIHSDVNIKILEKPLDIKNINYEDYSIVGSNFSTRNFLIGSMEEVERIKGIIFKELFL